MKFGLKLWSINDNYLEEAKRLVEQEVCDYIELYAVPGSFQQTIKWWKGFDANFIIHAPHFRNGLNLAKESFFFDNEKLISESIEFADELNAKHIVLHPGIGGETAEIIRQIKAFYDPRLIVENKPYLALFDGLICNGYSYEEMKEILSKTNTNMCLDFGHAICAAAILKKEPYGYVEKMKTLHPVMYHFTDGYINDAYDKHLHIGKGNFNIKKLLKGVENESMVTIETDKDSKTNLNDFENDIKYLRI